MNYLERVFKTLKKVYWEKLSVSLKQMAYILLILAGTSLVYWGIDYLVTNILSKI